MDNKVIILGINGHIGHAAAKAFAEAGWQVSGFGRSNKQPIAGMRFIKGDAEDVEAMRAAIGDIRVVVNALNLPYDKWDKGRKVAQTEQVIAALGTDGKTLLFPGNIYNYAANLRYVTPDLPQVPHTPRGEIRRQAETLYRAAAERGHIQMIVLRAGDFFGPEARGDWFDLVMFREAKKGKLSTMGARGIAHSWAYLPDLGRAFEKLAWHRAELGQFENFHFSGYFVTPEQMAQAIGAAAPGYRIGAYPRFTFAAMGVVSPLMREIGKMQYLWGRPMELRDERLTKLLGPGFSTPFETAVATTAGALLGEARKAA